MGREGMGWEAPSGGGSCSPSPSAGAVSTSPTGKRCRDPAEEEVYLDNFHSHKRYLSEIMAYSLNGLSVGDSLTENLMESPVRSDISMCCTRDEMLSQYSPMSEDSDDSRYCDTAFNTSVTQSDVVSSPTSPVSPHRYQKPHAASSSSNPYPLPGCNLAAVICSHQRRGSDSEGRFPSSPNDMCHTADLRRTALLRSVQMRAQPHCSPTYELPFNSGQDGIQSTEEEDRLFSCTKTSDDESEYRGPEQFPNVLEDGSQNDESPACQT
uniref:tRNA (Guanine(26)-N(2))-dimethyltransferase n=1 Tax=Anthurium amnicola TaxID=1678845 RepID=A0A1D1XTE5_9ARAE